MFIFKINIIFIEFSQKVNILVWNLLHERNISVEIWNMEEFVNKT